MGRMCHGLAGADGIPGLVSRAYRGVNARLAPRLVRRDLAPRGGQGVLNQEIS